MNRPGDPKEKNTSPGYLPGSLPTGSAGWKTIERMGPVGVEISTTDSVMVMSHFMLEAWLAD